jgi:hypothetical protein
MEGALDRETPEYVAVSVNITFFGVDTIWLNDVLTQQMIQASYVWRVLFHAVDSVGV